MFCFLDISEAKICIRKQYDSCSAEQPYTSAHLLTGILCVSLFFQHGETGMLCPKWPISSSESKKKKQCTWFYDRFSGNYFIQFNYISKVTLFTKFSAKCMLGVFNFVFFATSEWCGGASVTWRSVEQGCLFSFQALAG